MQKLDVKKTLNINGGLFRRGSGRWNGKKSRHKGKCNRSTLNASVKRFQ
jgi:hypothetical protein